MQENVNCLLWCNFFTRRRKKFTTVCQVLLEDEKVFACEDSFIRNLEKLFQENVKLLPKGRKIVHVGKIS